MSARCGEEGRALVVDQEVPDVAQAASVHHSAIRRELDAAGLGCRVCSRVSIYVRSLRLSALVEG